MKPPIISIATVLACLAVAAQEPSRPAANRAAGESADWAYKSDDGPHPVKTIETVVLHDAKRGKDLEIRVSWPKADGHFPVIVWSHGATGTKDMYQPLVRHWAGHGYVCLQANHSESRALRGIAGPGPNTFADWEDRPKDIAFILDALDEIEVNVPALKGKLDHMAIGVGGHSFGAHTAQLIAGATTVDAGGARRSHADPRPLAFVLLSPQGIGSHAAGLDGHSWDGVTRPFIVITGTNDIGRKGDDWQWRLDPWKYAPRKDKFLLVIEGAWHGFGGVVGADAGFRGAGPENPAHRLYVKSTSVAFWDAFLKKDPKAATFLRSETMAENTRGEAKLSYGVEAATVQLKGGALRADYATIFEDATWHDAKRNREVPVRIYAPKEAEGRLPALVFSHGGGESRDAFTYLGEHLARRGYLAVFLTHKGSDREEIEKATQGACRQESKIRDAFDGKGPTSVAKREEDKEEPREQACDATTGVQVNRMFQFFDRDRDGALSREEMPERLKRGFDAIDRDRNGKVSKDEMTAALENYQHRRGGGREEPRREEQQRREETPGPAAGLGCADPVRLRDAKRGKDLQVRVTWPEQQGSFPVIVFSHRVGGARHDYRPLVEHWAKGGYVVIQTDHSDSRELARSGPRLDWADRARDMSFVIDSLAEIEAKVPGMKGRIDARRIGAGGHLIGAYAACALAGQRNFSPNAPQGLKDERVKAALLLSPQGRGQGLTDKSWEDVAGPLMVLSGSAIPSLRTGQPAEWRREPFTFSPPGDKYLVWIEGLKADYAGLIEPGRGDDERAARWIKEATLAFWDAHLKGDAAARERLRAWPIVDADKTRFRLESKSGESFPAATVAAETATGAVKLHGDLAADYSARHGGRAVLAMVDGKTVFERYDNGFGPDTATHLHSATKGFWGPVIAAMIEDGLVESFDEPAMKILPEWKDDPRKSRITLRHLLNLNAGLVQDVVNLQGHDRPALAPDLYQHAIGVQALREPGAAFQYGPSCYYVLGEIMKRKLAPQRQTPLDYLKERILDPIGAKPGDWVHDATGNPHIPNGAHFTAREWIKYGQWLLQGGEWNAKQIVRRDLLAELVKPSATNPGHGLALWLNQPGGQGSHPLHVAPPGSKGGWIYNHGCTDLFAALGAGKCRLYVIPSFRMVALRQGDSPNDSYWDNTFLSLLMTGKATNVVPQRGVIRARGPAGTQ